MKTCQLLLAIFIRPALALSCLLLAWLCAVAALAAPQQSQIYWWDQRGVMRANIDGSDITQVNSTHRGELLVDQRSNSLYYSSFEVARSDLNGNNLNTLFYEQPDWIVVGYEGIALDYLRDQLYFIDAGWQRIYRSELDGTNATIVVPGNGSFSHLTPMQLLDIDPLREKLYWTNAQAFQRSNLDGTGVETLFTVSAWPSQIQLDVAGGKIYWSMWNGTPGRGSVNRANLDGSQRETLVSGLWGAYGLALDLQAGKMYFSDYWTAGPTNYDGTIRSANLDGSMVQTIMNFGPMYGPHGLALSTEVVPEPPSALALCLLLLVSYPVVRHAK